MVFSSFVCLTKSSVFEDWAVMSLGNGIGIGIVIVPLNKFLVHVVSIYVFLEISFSVLVFFLK